MFILNGKLSNVSSNNWIFMIKQCWLVDHCCLVLLHALIIDSTYKDGDAESDT